MDEIEYIKQLIDNNVTLIEDNAKLIEENDGLKLMLQRIYVEQRKSNNLLEWDTLLKLDWRDMMIDIDEEKLKESK